ncbi:MAG: 1-(5-phosphoribosyl)-5-[(5-phosphoribosylamino)methylideneamino]imidazole-4-carboxamide isomerase [Clostridiales bacterium GWB2_37_7]|nr:MAG: 1-(5-phosphoribosyl)-5-[(5-phosphoribosylamino)methylideneamino]imidazole-4-carboxamide isomerase [Clostridiales bacterium GWB2_37_7]
MILYPAIDILEGKCVRLFQGKREEVKVFYDDPVDAAKMWEGRGAKAIHIVDLEGAFDGEQKNLQHIERIAKSVSIPIQVGGGIRSIKALRSLLNCGVKRPILGTSALTDEEFLIEALDICKGNLVVSIDVKEGKVSIDGWVNTSSISGFDFAEKLVSKGVKTVVYTDISRDGTMMGANLLGLEQICSVSGIKVIASGGVRSIEDIVKIKEIGAEGVISGLALYNGTINFEDANQI